MKFRAVFLGEIFTGVSLSVAQAQEVWVRKDPPEFRSVGGGATLPRWTMTAYDAGGKELGSVGEQPGSSPEHPKYFGIDVEGIVRLEIKANNLLGDTVQWQWSSLPIAGFGYDR